MSTSRFVRAPPPVYTYGSSISSVRDRLIGNHFRTTARFWLNLQAQYDLDTEQDRLGDRLDAEVVSDAG